jgi:propanol-preferring alcohol dehydrogenase
MRAIVINDPRSAGGAISIAAASVSRPDIGDNDVLIEVDVCGVCRTDLDVAEGRLIAPHYPVIPGHQVVGRVVAIGKGVGMRRVGDRVGVAWIHRACGRCRWCLRGEENLCPYFESTGCAAPGGYAELIAVPAAFTYEIPHDLSDAEAAPLLCAGAIGWRSLQLARLSDGDPLGFTGFGASAHLVLQLARHLYPKSPLYVFARSERERAFARELGAAWAGDTADTPPDPLAAIIDTTPAWTPVVEALHRLMPGGRLVINAIRKASADREVLSRIDYATDLWMEREIKSVANVARADVTAMLDAAVRFKLRPTVERMPLEDAGVALERLRSGSGMRGAIVLDVRQ